MPNRLRVVIASLGVLLAVAGATSACHSSGGGSPADPVHYVALGDSYSAGVGAGPYRDDSGTCSRSDKAYSALWAAQKSPATYRSVACSGATTSDVRSRQLSALSSTTTLVSITIGGNDVGFTDVLSACLLEGEAACRQAVQHAEDAVRASLPGALDALFAALHRKASKARVVVLDYPRLYNATAGGCPGLPSASRVLINQGADLLDAAIRTAAAKAHFVFGDVRTTFTGHAVCDSTPWLNAVDASDLSASYHPNALGYRDGYLPVFTAKAG